MNIERKPEWPPPEPPWLQEMREIEARMNGISERIEKNVDRYIRGVRFEVVLVPLITSVVAGGSLYFVGWMIRQ